MLNRRRFLGLTAAAAAALAVDASQRRAAPVMAESALVDQTPGGTALVAQAATTGPPAIPASIPLRLSDGSTCSIEMEEYLKGVVPAEMPASWHPDALKAQAVAARTYAASYVATYGYICSTTSCQVWNPSRRHASTDAAVEATRGELLTYQGGMIWAYYSSTCGGQTQTDAGQAGVYCRSVRCWRETDGSGREPLDLSSEAAAADFWRGTPPSFCSASPLYRYDWSLSRAEQEQVIDRYLPAITTSSPRYQAGQLGELRELAVAARWSSGKVRRLRITGTGGTWEVTGELALRSLLRAGPSASLQRSANAVLSLERDGATLTRVVGRGGGFGHGIGLCQYGARGMADRGYDYGTILRHYYSGVDVVRVASSAALSQPSRRIILPMVWQGPENPSACRGSGG